MPQKPTTDSVNSSSTYPVTLREFLNFTTWQTTSFLVFSLVRKSNCPGVTEEARRMTAPVPKISTVLVDSEKGSRLSLPSTARAPLIVTGTSSATGCCLIAESPGSVGTGEGRCTVSGLEVEFSFSLTIGGMACTLAQKNFRSRPVPDRVPHNIYMFCLKGEGQHSTWVLKFAGNTCPDGQV